MRGEKVTTSVTGGSVGACRHADHRTIVSRRLQRSDDGQRHTCHACPPSPIEKKMILQLR
jgi:hypothetical protein